jgi:DNA polymerase III gamma/tau subunit
MFGGPKGTGKTTTARILALSLQCKHQDPDKWGNPCKECLANRSSFPIIEINASDITGIDKLRDIIQSSDYGLLGSGSYRVYILDETHRLSDSAQNLLLKYLEDTPETTVFILCSSMPYKMLEALRRRCIYYELRELDYDDTTKLVTRLLKKVKSELPVDRLVDALVERQIKSSGLIAQAVEKYVACSNPEDAAQVEGSSTLDVKALTKAVTKGSWPDVCQALQASEGMDIRVIRGSMLAYLKTILLESQDFSKRNEAISKAIKALCAVENAPDAVVSASMSAELYLLTELFSRYKL